MLAVSEKISQLQKKNIPVLVRSELISELITTIPKSELALVINKSPSYISNHLRLLRLPEIIKDGLVSKEISEGHARAISFLADTSEMTKIYEAIMRRGLSVRDTEEEVNRLRKTKRRYGSVSPMLLAQTEAISTKWGISVKLVRKDGALVLIMNFPLGIIFLRKLESILKKLLG